MKSLGLCGVMRAVARTIGAPRALRRASGGRTFKHMMKQLSLSLALVFAVACKTDSPAPAAGSSADPSSGKARSAKIDLKPSAAPPPSLAAGSSDDEAAPPEGRGDHRLDPAAREEWRKRRMERMDKDGDGKISDEERAAAMKERMDAMRARLDTDGDGKVTPAELAAARGNRIRMEDPAALDTNHDGDISSDELAAGMKARRDARRAARDGDAATPPPAPTPGTAAQ